LIESYVHASYVESDVYIHIAVDRILVSNIAVEIIAVDNDVELASWGDDLRGDLVPLACRCRV